MADMVPEQVQLLERLKNRISQLIGMCEFLNSENLKLSGEIDNLRLQLKSECAANSELNRKCDNLLVARDISSDDKQERELSKLRLNKLIREVDKCISLLGE